MGILRKLAIALLVFLIVAGAGLYFLSRGHTAELSVDDVAGTEPILVAPEAESFPTVQIAKPVGWDDGQSPDAADGLSVNRFAAGLDHPACPLRLAERRCLSDPDARTSSRRR